MTKINEMRQEILKKGSVTLDIDGFNELQAEWFELSGGDHANELVSNTDKKADQLPPWTDGLSVRIASCLVNAGFNNIKEVSDQHRAGYDFLEIQRIRKHDLPELQAWLDSIHKRGDHKLKGLFSD